MEESKENHYFCLGENKFFFAEAGHVLTLFLQPAMPCCVGLSRSKAEIEENKTEHSVRGAAGKWKN